MLVQQESDIMYDLQLFSCSKVPFLLLSFAGLDLCKALCKTMWKFCSPDMQVVGIALLTELISACCNRKHVIHVFSVAWELSNC